MQEYRLKVRIQFLENKVKELSKKLGVKTSLIDYNILNETDVFYFCLSGINQYLTRGDVKGLIKGEVQSPLYNINTGVFQSSNGWTYGDRGIEKDVTELRASNEKESKLFIKEERLHFLSNKDKFKELSNLLKDVLVAWRDGVDYKEEGELLNEEAWSMVNKIEWDEI